tara:strand:+ start:1056 stop:1169 length:114 start_codon:yes stop_codon:yes gene_type:complete
MTELEILFYQDREEFNKLFSDSLVYDFDFMELIKNEN